MTSSMGPAIAWAWVWVWGATAALAPLAGGQDDVVRLKSGDMIAGKVLSSDGAGVTVERIDGRGVVTIAWTLIPEWHHDRYKETLPEIESAEGPTQPTLDGVRIITSFRTVEGLLVEEDAEAKILRVKTSDSRSPVPIPSDVVLVREPIKVTEAQVYTPEELMERMLLQTDLTKLDQVEKAAQYALSLGFPAKALELYGTARSLVEAKIAEAETAPGMTDEERNARYEELNGELAALELRMKEIEAAATLKEIEETAAAGDYDTAIARAETWIQEYGETELGTKNVDLASRLTAERDEFAANRAKLLSKKIVEEFPKIVNKEVRKAARLDTVDSAIKEAESIDDRILAALTAQFKATKAEVEEWWAAAVEGRSKHKHRALLGTGTWILHGGQDGGYDSARGSPSGGGNSPLPQNVPQNIEELRERYGGGGGRQGGQTPVQSRDPRKQLQTRADWWRTQAGPSREGFLEAVWAAKSKLVQLDPPRERNCPTCAGQGALKALRGDTFVDVVCARCHGAQKEIELSWW